MKLALRGWKGLTGEWEIPHHALISGPNGAGKSAILAAIQLALTGTVPSLGLGKDGAQDAGKLLAFAPEGADVRLEIGDATYVVKIEPTAKSAKITRSTEYRTKGKGLDIPIEPLFLDFAAFASLTPGDRRSTLVRWIGIDDDAAIPHMRAYALDRMIAAMERKGKDSLLSVAPSVADDAIAGAAKRLSERLRDAERTYVRDHLAFRPGETPDAIIDRLHDEALTQERTRKGKAAVAVEVAAVAAGPSVGPGKTEAEIELDLSAVRLTLARVETAERDARKITETAERRTRLTALIAARDAEIATAKAAQAAAGDLGALRQEMAIVTAGEPASPAESGKLDAAHMIAVAAVEACRAVWSTARDRLAALSGDTCPTCGGKGADLARAKAAAEAAFDGAHTRAEAASLSLACARKDLSMSGQIRERWAADHAAWTQRRAALLVRIEAHGKQDAILSRAHADRESYVTQLALLPDAVDAAPSAGGGAEVDASAALAAQIADLEAALSSMRRSQAKTDVIAEGALGDVEILARLAKAAHAGAVAGLSAYVQGKVQPVLDGASVVLSAILGFGLRVRIDLDSRRPVLGWSPTDDVRIGAAMIPAGRLVSLEAMSRGQAAAFAASLMLVLAPGSAPLLVEAAEEDRALLIGTLSALGKHAGPVVLASCHRLDQPPDGWPEVAL